MGTLRNALIVVAVLSVRAHADNIQDADKLFAEGLALRDTNLEQSCEKFNKSLELNAQAIGTLMNVALCDEKLGHIASAVKHFSEAVARAKEGNLPEYEKEAQTHITALTPDLPYVEFKFVGWVPDTDTKVVMGDLVIKIEPDKVEKGQKVAVDPGELDIVVSKDKFLPFRTKILIGKKETKSVDIPKLEKSVTVKSSRKSIGKITTFTGLGFVAAGVVLGLVARHNYNKPFDDGKCSHDTKVCDANFQGDTESAITLGWVGTFVGGAGIAAAGFGLYLWLTAPAEKNPEEQRSAHLVPTVTPETAGLSVVGSF